ALGDAAIALAGLRFERSANISDAVRLFHWQWELQFQPGQIANSHEYRLGAVRPSLLEAGWMPVQHRWLMWVRNSEGIRYSEVSLAEKPLLQAITEFRALCADSRSDLATLRQ